MLGAGACSVAVRGGGCGSCEIGFSAVGDGSRAEKEGGGVEEAEEPMPHLPQLGRDVQLTKGVVQDGFTHFGALPARKGGSLELRRG